MPVVAYKCTSCGGELKYNAELGKFVCEYCGTEFTKEELENSEPLTDGKDIEKENTVQEEKEESTEEAFLYTCPNCGGEILTDSTTAATECYYCHSPVVLSGRLSGKYLPKRLIPFKFDRKNALEKFNDWTRKKFFLPKDFYNEKQIEKFTGVYYPYWIIDVDSDASVSATGEIVRTWTTGNTTYTNTKVFNVQRKGVVHLEDLVKAALKKSNKKLVENVQPFDEQALEPFSMTYLSGFQAEKRNVEPEEIKDEVNKDINYYSKQVIDNTVSGYTAVKGEVFNCVPESIDWEYGLLPVWVMTYPYKNNMYYFAMNGQSGKICGKLPVDKKKLAIFAGAISVALCAILLLGGYFLI